MRRWLLAVGLLVAATSAWGFGAAAQGPFSAQIQSALRAFVNQTHTWTADQVFDNVTVAGTCTGCGGGGTPGGADGDLQYNNGGAFGGFGDFNDGTSAATFPGTVTSTGFLQNALAIFPAQLAQQGANQTLNANDTLTDATGLFYTHGSGVSVTERWIGELYLITDGAAAADLKFNLSVPANASYTIASANCLAIGTASGTSGDITLSATSSAGANVQCGTTGVGTFLVFQIKTTVSCSAAASCAGGTVTLQWAQLVSTGSNSTVYSASYWLLFKVS